MKAGLNGSEVDPDHPLRNTRFPCDLDMPDALVVIEYLGGLKAVYEYLLQIIQIRIWSPTFWVVCAYGNSKLSPDWEWLELLFFLNVLAVQNDLANIFPCLFCFNQTAVHWLPVSVCADGPWQFQFYFLRFHAILLQL